MELIERFAKLPDYHQLDSYSRVMQEIGWQVIKLKGNNQLFVKPLGPVAFAKLQRPGKLDLAELVWIQKQQRIVKLVLEPGLQTRLDDLAPAGFRPTASHYAYTKTLIVDLSGSLEKILATFSKTTSYQMRRSAKMGVEYQHVPFAKLSEAQQREILKLHALWSKEKKVAGYDDGFMKALWKHVREGTMILAYKEGQLHGALFLIVHHKLGMYFYQFSSGEARGGLYIPSGMAFQAIKLAKGLGCTLFDLCSAYDERYPQENLKWQGFSAHKERFHPTPVYYPTSYGRSIFS